VDGYLTDGAMQPLDPILFRELPVIQKIIEDETWLEGERRGCHVLPSDRVVRERVCNIILRIGHQLRESLNASTRPSSASCATGSNNSTLDLPPQSPEAA
jgi:hypothetical protein